MPDTDFSLPALTAEQTLAMAAAGTLRLLDLRKPAARQADGRCIRGALVRDPYLFCHQDVLMQSETPIAAFCVHGHEVSRFGCALMLLHGRKAFYVSGGFAALAAAGAQLEEIAR